MLDDKKVGGVIVKIDKETHHNHLELFFVLPDEHSKAENELTRRLECLRVVLAYTGFNMIEGVQFFQSGVHRNGLCTKIRVLFLYWKTPYSK